MQVGRTVEQLKKRRHAFLAPYIPPIQERQYQNVDHSEEVGQLKGIIGGEKRSLIITLGEDFWIGRRPECDLILDDPSISNFHLRIYAVRTSCRQSLICLHDLSTNGFILNDIPYKATQTLDIGGKSCSTRSVIIRPGDVVRFPDSSIELVCRYFSRHSEATQTTQNIPGQVQCNVTALFKTSDSSLTRTLDPWIIQNFTLGTGSFGRVHLATHKEISGLQVACKTVGISAQIELEIQVLKGLDHPNICGIYDMSKEEDEGLIHLFLPLVSGGDLFSYLEKHVMLTEDEAKFAAYQLLKAVEFLHERGIAHRDIKPENVLLHKSGAYPHLLLADFGLATTRDLTLDSVPFAKTQMAGRHHRVYTGTSLYIPPERLKAILSRKRSNSGQAESFHGKAWRTEMGRIWFAEETMMDIWAIGVVIYLIMTGFHPYDERTNLDDHPTPAPTSSATTQRQSSARSWDEFRSTNPSRSVGESGQTEQEIEWRRVENRCAKFTNLLKTHWEPVGRWTDISVEAQDFVAGLLNRHPTKRLTIGEAQSDVWLETHQSALDEIYDNVVIQGKLERASVWNRNGGVPPANMREIEVAKLAQIDKANHPNENGPSKASTSRSVRSAQRTDATSDADHSPTPAIIAKKAEAATKRKTVDTPTAPKSTNKKTKTKSKRTSLSEDPEPAPPPITKPSRPIKYRPEPRKNGKKNTPLSASRRPSSLFLPNSGIFADLDDIAEEAEDAAAIGADNASESLATAAMTLNDLLTTGGDQGDSGSTTAGPGGSGDTTTLGMETQELSFPPIRAGQRKSLVSKQKGGGLGIGGSAAGSSKFLPASKLAALAEAASLRPSDLAITLQDTDPTIPARKSSFQPPAPSVSAAKSTSKRVVLKRIDKA